MTRNYSSTAVATTLSAPCTAVSASVSVTSTAGFPAPPFILALDAGASAQELVLVTGVSSLDLTVTRGYDSTSAQTHSTGSVVQHVHGGIDFREARQHEGASTGVHGVTGAVVGTTDTQTLTNKTLTDPVLAGTLTGPGVDWQTYAPSVSGFGATVNRARYCQIGKTVHAEVAVSVSTAPTGTITLGLPVPAAATGAQRPLGVAIGLDGGSGYHMGYAHADAGTTVQFRSGDGTGVAWSASVPFTWVGGGSDWVSFNITYEAA